MHEIQAKLREQIDLLRSFSVELRPYLLEQFGLVSAIRSHVETLGRQNDAIVFRMVDNPVDKQLDKAVSLALFRILQESLSNAIKHNQGAVSEIAVRMARDDHTVRLEIQDNGKGFELPDDWFSLAQHGHLGMIGMRERIEAVGGTIGIDTQPGQGTRIVASAPLHPRSSPPAAE